MNQATSRKECASCSGSCQMDCGGQNFCCGGCCALPAALSREETVLLEALGIFPFLPLVQDRDSGTVTLLETGLSGETARRGLSLLLRRGLVAMDNQAPLENYDYSPYQHHLLGSVGLTLLGQETLDDLEYGGNNASFLF